MKHHCLKLIVLLAAAVIAIAPASAQNFVTVTPQTGASAGWSWTWANGGTGRFTNSGPALNEDGTFPMGNGAWFAECGYNGDINVTPSSVWLGLDQVNGQSLANLPIKNITDMRYNAFVSAYPTTVGNSADWQGPCQPISLTIVITKDGINRRTLIHRPWGNSGDFSRSRSGSWQTIDAMLGPWFVVQSGVFYDSWASVCAAFPNGKLVPTSTAYNPSAGQYMSVGWDSSTTPAGDPSATGTGKTINLEVGGRKSVTNIFGQTGWAWWRESAGFRGYVDGFELAVDLGTPTAPNVVDNVYDFEPDPNAPAPRLVALNQTGVGGTVTTHSLLEQGGIRFKVFGRVVAADANTFDITDGTGSGLPYPIRVYAPGHSAQVGQYWSAIGEVKKLIWGNEPKQYYLWSCVRNCDRLDG